MKNNYKVPVFFCYNIAKTVQHYNTMRMIFIKIRSWIIKKVIMNFNWKYWSLKEQFLKFSCDRTVQIVIDLSGFD